MHKKIVLFVWIYILSTININAQTENFENFKSLRSSGLVPEDFTKLSSLKYIDDKKTITTTSVFEKNTQNKFLLESNFLMDDILQSGRVIFGDPVTNYLNELKNIILKDDTITKNKIRIYTLLTNEVNAYTSDNGIVLVSTGLIAQVENEAQIVFILCHEFTHYLKRHAINNYVEDSRIERKGSIYKGLRGQEIDLAKFSYSKELESEADKLGLELFNKTNYNLAEAEGVFDVLLYSYLPFDEVEFDKTFFDDGNYNLPQQYFLDSVNAITAVEDYDDETSSHPNIKKRREVLQLASRKMGSDEKKSFILEEEYFRSVQKLCRFQGCNIALTELKYEEAIYQAYLLLQRDSTNQYLKNVITQALYGIAMYKNSSIWPEEHIYYKNVEGNIQQVYFFIFEIPQKELNILALKHAWESHLADPENRMISKICEQLAYEMVNVNNTVISDFNTNETQIIPEVAVDSVLSEDPSVTINIEPVENKYEKIKSKKDVVDIEDPILKNEYWKFAFIPYLEDENFTLQLDVKNELPPVIKETPKKRKQKPQFNLGLSEIVIVDPQLLRVDERKEMPVLHLESEIGKLELREIIERDANALKLDIKYLDYVSLLADGTETFNDLALLNIWIQEKLAHLNNSMDMINSTNDQFQELATKYNIDNFAWIGILELRLKEEGVGYKVFLSFFWPVAPFYLYQLLDPNNYTYFFTIVANGNTGKVSILYSDIYKHNDIKSSEARNIYYILDEIKD